LDTEIHNGQAELAQTKVNAVLATCHLLPQLIFLTDAYAGP
jgi:hypothetical protein